MHIYYDLRVQRYFVLDANDKTVFSALSWKTCQDYIDDNSR